MDVNDAYFMTFAGLAAVGAIAFAIWYRTPIRYLTFAIVSGTIGLGFIGVTLAINGSWTVAAATWLACLIVDAYLVFVIAIVKRRSSKAT